MKRAYHLAGAVLLLSCRFAVDSVQAQSGGLITPRSTAPLKPKVRNIKRSQAKTATTQTNRVNRNANLPPDTRVYDPFAGVESPVYNPFTIYNLYPNGYGLTTGGYVLNGIPYQVAPNTALNGGTAAGNESLPLNSVAPSIVNVGGNSVIGPNGIMYSPPVVPYVPAYSAGVAPDSASETPTAPPAGNTANDYFLSPQARREAAKYANQAIPGKVQPILEAMRTEFKNSWLNNDPYIFQRYVNPGERIAVYLNGKYQYSLNGSAYMNLTKRAMNRKNTTGFALDSAQRIGSNVYRVLGRHGYTDASGAAKTVRVSYVVALRDRRLFIKQTSADAL